MLFPAIIKTGGSLFFFVKKRPKITGYSVILRPFYSDTRFISPKKKESSAKHTAIYF